MQSTTTKGWCGLPDHPAVYSAHPKRVGPNILKLKLCSSAEAEGIWHISNKRLENCVRFVIRDLNPKIFKNTEALYVQKASWVCYSKSSSTFTEFMTQNTQFAHFSYFPQTQETCLKQTINSKTSSFVTVVVNIPCSGLTIPWVSFTGNLAITLFSCQFLRIWIYLIYGTGQPGMGVVHVCLGLFDCFNCSGCKSLPFFSPTYTIKEYIWFPRQSKINYEPTAWLRKGTSGYKLKVVEFVLIY